jgi:hypothetical protein
MSRRAEPPQAAEEGGLAAASRSSTPWSVPASGYARIPVHGGGKWTVAVETQTRCNDDAHNSK